MEIPLTKAILVFLVTLASATYDFVVKPEFGERTHDLNITAYVGQTSRLPCTVKHLSGKRVSWIRQRDLQVLSTGRVTFSTDLRISVLPGTRFQLRKPRDLILQNQLPLLVSNKTNRSLGDPANDGPVIGSPPLLHPQDSKWEDRKGTERNIHPITTSKTSSTISLDGYEPIGLHKRSFQFHIRKNIRREPRNVGHKHRTRQKNYWYKEDHWGPLSFQPKYYTFTGNKGRYKKALTFQKDKGLTKVKSLVSSQEKGQGREKLQAYTKQNNPIAIYPQGPISSGSDSKSLKLIPNYIDGVWEPEDYTLQIKYTKPQDAGIYICQINTEPRITQAVVLKVVKMRAEIVGRQELFVKAGNPVKLSCRVNHGALSPGFILWYKGERLVEYENSGGRIQVLMEGEGVSHLLLNNAEPQDSANYTCSPAGGAPASLILNVIVDERQAAMQQGNHCPPATSSTTVLWPTLVLAHLLSNPLDHLQPIFRFLFSAILLGINSFLSWPFKITVFVLLLMLLSSSANGRHCWTPRATPFVSQSPTITSSSSFVNIASLLRSFCCWIQALTKGFPLPLRLSDKQCVMIIGFIVCVCVSVFLGRNSFVSEVF